MLCGVMHLSCDSDALLSKSEQTLMVDEKLVDERVKVWHGGRNLFVNIPALGAFHARDSTPAWEQAWKLPAMMTSQYRTKRVGFKLTHSPSLITETTQILRALGHRYRSVPS